MRDHGQGRLCAGDGLYEPGEHAETVVRQEHHDIFRCEGKEDPGGRPPLREGGDGVQGLRGYGGDEPGA